VHVLVYFRLYELAIGLDLLAIMICRCSVYPIINPDRVSLVHVTIFSEFWLICVATSLTNVYSAIIVFLEIKCDFKCFLSPLKHLFEERMCSTKLY
jgi:hypothetical protein